jgi:putative iron-dependent peroxidase
MFVGFAADQGPLARMLDSMVGLDGPRDELTRYTTPKTGGYYFVPAVSALRAFASVDDG